MGKQLALFRAPGPKPGPLAQQPGFAALSPCGTYRYLLTRGLPSPLRWMRPVTFVMLNPSTADADRDDPTIRRCLAFARAWQCTELRVVNLFAYRATDPKELLQAADPVGPENDEHIRRAARGAAFVVAAWGAHKVAEERAQHVLGLIDGLKGIGLQCLGTTKSGAPRHPLYVPADQERERWRLSA